MIDLIYSHEAFEALRRASAVDAQYNSRHRSCPPCDPDTRIDILNKIFEWLYGDNDHSICWLYGIAGSGKSAIAQTVSERIAEKKLAASLFFNQLERDLCVKEYIIATVAYQLAISIPALKRPICDVITRDETILKAVFADQLSKLIIEPLKSLSETYPSMVIIIDGLDECNDYSEVAQLMTQLSDPSNLHMHFQFLVTSRPEPFIRAVFEHPTVNHITTQFNLQDFGPDSDIRSFLERELQDIPRVRFGVMSEISLPWP
jgi:Cdc6-like AAA superfamily ATPase